MPQLLPRGLEETLPLPFRVTVRLTVGFLSKVAVTERASDMETVQVVPLLLSQPVQPVKTEVVAGEAVRVTDEPWAKGAEQVPPQLIPAGLEVTVPPPPLLPLDLDTERVCDWEVAGTQLDCWQAKPAAQAVPQVPQFLMSVAVSTQTPLHDVSPEAQVLPPLLVPPSLR